MAKSQLNITAREAHWDKFKEILVECKDDKIWTIQEMVMRFQEIDPTFSEQNSLSYLGSFHYLGYIFYYPEDENLKNYIFINPDWVIKSIYEILDYSVLNSNGVFDKNHVFKKMDDQYTLIFISLLKKFELIFEDKEIHQYIAPQYLPDELKDQKEWNKLKARFNSFNRPDFTLSFPDFLPRSIMLRFLAKYGAEAIGQEYWKNGISFMLDGKVILLLCDYDKMIFKVFVEDADLYIQRKVFDKLNEIMENRAIFDLSIDGTNFVSYAELLEAVRKNNSNIGTTSSKIISRSVFDYFTQNIETLKKIIMDSQFNKERSINIFISYSHQDDKTKNELEKYLKVIQNYYDNNLNVWTDKGIKPGSNWDSAIKKQIENADVILFLISNNFLASNYILNTEIKNAIERFKNKQQIILPIYVEEVSKKLLPFREKQYLPGSTPLKDWKPQNKGWTKIQEGLITIIDDVKAGKFQEYFE